MKSIDAFKQELKDLLIEHDGDVNWTEHPNIVAEAKEIGITETQLSKLLIEIDATIPWDNIRKDKAEAEKKAEELRIEAEKKQEEENNAGETLQFIIEQCAADGHFSTQEIKVYFETSSSLNQDEKKSAQILKDFLKQNNYIPLTTPKGNSIKNSLQSTDWYKDKLPEIIPYTPKPDEGEPQQKKRIWIWVLLFIILITSIGGYLYWKDGQYPRKYIIANSAVIREEPIVTEVGSSTQKIENGKYGQQLKIVDSVYNDGRLWYIIRPNFFQKKYLSSKLTCDKQDFYRLNSAWSDPTTKETIEKVQCRRAIIQYFNKWDFIGVISQNVYKEVFGKAMSSTEAWQVIALDNNIKPNYYFLKIKPFPNSNLSEFLFTIKNVNSGSKKVILYALDIDDLNTEPILLYEEDVPNGIEFVKSVVTNNGVYHVNYIK